MLGHTVECKLVDPLVVDALCGKMYIVVSHVLDRKKGLGLGGGLIQTLTQLERHNFVGTAVDKELRASDLANPAYGIKLGTQQKSGCQRHVYTGHIGQARERGVDDQSRG